MTCRHGIHQQVPLVFVPVKVLPVLLDAQAAALILGLVALWRHGGGKRELFTAGSDTV